MNLMTIAFSLPVGVEAYAFYPGAIRNDVADNDIWLAAGVIERISISGIEGTAGAFNIHDYQNLGAVLSDGRLIAGGTTKAPGRLTVTGAGAMIALADGTPMFECYGTNNPAAFTVSNRKASYALDDVTLGQLDIGAACLNGMAILYVGTSPTDIAHSVNVTYRPITFGGARKRAFLNSTGTGYASASW